MNFELSDDQRLLKRNAREFLRKEIAPLVEDGERRSPLAKAEVHDLLRKLRPLGYIDGLVPEEFGGGGLDALTYGLLFEELSYHWAGLAGTVMIQSTMTRGMAVLGTAEQRARLLAPLMAADQIICFGLTEPNAGSNSAALRTTAALDGDHYIVNGNKIWISNAPVSDIAMVVAVTDKGNGRHGISRLLVERAVSPYESRDLHKLGLRVFPTGELAFQDCRVPRENLYGEEGTGYRQTLQDFEMARSLLGICATGIAQAALDATIKYAREREQFGRPIGRFQLVQAKIADMYALTEAARLLSYRALTLLDRGARCSTATSLAKGYATEAAIRVASEGLQVHGGMGLSPEFPLERLFRDARTLTIPDGTTEIQKLIIGRDLLGMSAIE